MVRERRIVPFRPSGKKDGMFFDNLLTLAVKKVQKKLQQ